MVGATKGGKKIEIGRNIFYKKEKSLKMNRDVGMVCQKVHKQGRGYKSKDKYTKPHPSLHLFTIE